MVAACVLGVRTAGVRVNVEELIHIPRPSVQGKLTFSFHQHGILGPLAKVGNFGSWSTCILTV